MHTLLLHLPKSRVFCATDTRRGKYKHTFGGPARHKGIEISGTPFQACLYYNFNLSDPIFGFEIPGVKWLPLYWAPPIFRHGFGYRVVSDDEIEIFSKPATKDFSGIQVSQELPELEIVLSKHSFDPAKEDDAYEFSGVFGLEHLSGKRRREVLERLRRDYRETYEEEPPDSVDELLYCQGNNPLFFQGVPRDPCPNPRCKNHNFREHEARTYRGVYNLLFAIFPEEEDGELYQDLAGDFGQLVFGVCKDCYSVFGVNYCT